MSKKITYECNICSQTHARETIYGIRVLTLGGSKSQFISVDSESILLDECLYHLCSKCIKVVNAGVFYNES